MTPEPETNGSPTPGLGPGTESDAVRALQSHLKGLGAYDGPEDGVFGPQTENAVRSVQRSHGLPPTGVADSQTEQLITAAAAADGGAERGTPAAVDAESGRLVVNETNKRVVVHAKSGEVLVLSPLERRLIGNDDLELFEEELRELERQCIVALPRPRSRRATRRSSAAACGWSSATSSRASSSTASSSGSAARSRSSSARWSPSSSRAAAAGRRPAGARRSRRS